LPNLADFAPQQKDTGNATPSERQWLPQDIHSSMASRNPRGLKELEELDIAALRAIWRQTFKSPPPKAARKEFLVRIISYALQEQLQRTLSKACAKMLREFETGSRPAESRSAMGETELRPGVRLIREWGGTPHEVMVMERGYAYRGTSYSSLSEVARHITGARWSGPRFFGLKKKARAAMAEGDA
jgi:hypothetical protein